VAAFIAILLLCFLTITVHDCPRLETSEVPRASGSVVLPGCHVVLLQLAHGRTTLLRAKSG
jgi:hypothetical protein